MGLAEVYHRARIRATRYHLKAEGDAAGLGGPAALAHRREQERGGARGGGTRKRLEAGPFVGPGIVVLEGGAQHAFMGANPTGDPAHQHPAAGCEVGFFQQRVTGKLQQPAFAVTCRKLHQRVEVSLLAVEPAVERADGRADICAQRFDRQFAKAAGPQQFRAGLQQRKRGFAAAFLPRRRDAGQVELLRSRRHPGLRLPIILIIIRIII